MEKWCSSNNACLLVFVPFHPDQEWWNTLSTLNLPYIQLRNKLSYLYKHRKYIGRSKFLTCILFLGCTVLGPQCNAVENDHLGFWKPSDPDFFEGVRFPTQNLLFERCLSILERKKLKEQTYQTGLEIEQTLTEKLRDFEKPFERDDLSERIFKVNDAIKVVEPMGVTLECSTTHRHNLEKRWRLKDYTHERKIYTLETYQEVVKPPKPQALYCEKCNTNGHSTTNCILKLQSPWIWD